MDLSIIIPVYNAAPLLNRCLDSVFSQTTNYTYEVILIDDGSTDNSVEIIKSRNEKNIILFQQQNAGPAIARNKGVELASGEYCTYLDADDYWLPTYIQESLDLIKSNNTLVAVNVAQKHYIVGGIPIIMPRYIENKVKLKPFILDDFYSFWATHEHVGTCSATIKTSILKQCGGQRKDLRICEDLEFWPYIASYGKWGFIPHVLYISDGGEIQKRYGWKKYILRFKNIPTFDKWFERLAKRLTKEQIKSIQPVLNGVVLGISRAMISGGDFTKARKNMKYAYKDCHNYIYKIYRYGGVIGWYSFASAYRAYQYLKINWPYIKYKLSIK
ncbi:glycosyltransferase family 2 protein [Phocaeicola plebeius]|uniref:glycosyltransferase family 2 protein n=1 Tax=Phocaeicola plebeius TaxID=310297 RepID=UPI0026EAA337|nr:glycosyltransferase family 2 protein [Phocaeicola plebeius]